MLSTSGQYIVDQHGRQVILKGCSVAGNCKYPQDLPTHTPDLKRFYDHRSASFVDKPFPLKDAPAHFQRLKKWGMTTIRLIVTWEALEHEGPGVYDEAYIDYVSQLIHLMGSYGLNCIIDCHQDLFSRFCGGDGAPGWTLELAGFSVPDLDAALAAHIQSENLSTKDPPPSVWPSGYQKLSTATMFTLFFGGDDWASKVTVPSVKHAAGGIVFPGQLEVGIGTFLQQSYFAAFKRLASKLQHHEAIIGIEPMNEPHHGYLNLYSFNEWNPMTDLAWCFFPSALEGMALGAGYPQDIGYYVRSFPHPTRLSHKERIVPPKPVWRPGAECIWMKHGVWAWDESHQRPIVLRKSYFEINPRTQQPVKFYDDCWFPFIRGFAGAVQSAGGRTKDWLIFAGGVPNEFAPAWPREVRPNHLVYAPHFYDLHTLFAKTFGNFTVNVQGLSRGMFPLKGIHLGRSGVNNNYAIQTANLTHPELPSYFSELGTTFEANLPPFHDERDRFKRSHPNLHWLTRQIDALLNAMDALGCGYAYWLYNHDNDASSALQLGDYGDGWAGEDFSFVFKAPDKDPRQLGTRCMDAWLRPSPTHIAGRQSTWKWDMHSLEFSLSLQRSSEVESAETLIYLPASLYAVGGLDVAVSEGHQKYDSETQTLTWMHSTGESMAASARSTLRVTVNSNAEQSRRLQSRRPDIDIEGFWARALLLALLVLLAAVVMRSLSSTAWV